MPGYIQLFFTAVAVVTLLTVVIALTRPNRSSILLHY
jgi:hypothetical protein